MILNLCQLVIFVACIIIFWCRLFQAAVRSSYVTPLVRNLLYLKINLTIEPNLFVQKIYCWVVIDLCDFLKIKFKHLIEVTRWNFERSILEPHVLFYLSRSRFKIEFEIQLWNYGAMNSYFNQYLNHVCNYKNQIEKICFLSPEILVICWSWDSHVSDSKINNSIHPNKSWVCFSKGNNLVAICCCDQFRIM